MSPNPHDRQSDTLQELRPGLFRALARRHERHHQPVKSRGCRVSAAVRDHYLVDQDFAVSRFHGGDKMVEYFATFLVGPVVEDRVHEVSSGA